MDTPLHDGGMSSAMYLFSERRARRGASERGRAAVFRLFASLNQTNLMPISLSTCLISQCTIWLFQQRALAILEVRTIKFYSVNHVSRSRKIPFSIFSFSIFSFMINFEKYIFKCFLGMFVYSVLFSITSFNYFCFYINIGLTLIFSVRQPFSNR